MVARIKSWLAPVHFWVCPAFGVITRLLKLSPWALLPSPWQKHVWCPHCTDAALAWTEPTMLGDWSHRGGHPSLPAQCQNLHAAKSVRMFLKLRSSNWVSPQRDLVPSISPLVPKRGFKVLWLPLYSAALQLSHQSHPGIRTLCELLVITGWGWLCPCWCIHTHAVQDVFPLNDTPS